MMYRLIDPSHPMYDAALAAKYGDAIRAVYRRADQFVAEVMEHVEPGTTIMIVSDHGFHSWRKSVNLNTWLVQQGYMTVSGQAPGEKKLDDLFGGGEFWENVDWSRTRAYAMGLGQIYFNLRGREARGIVSPGRGVHGARDRTRREAARRRCSIRTPASPSSAPSTSATTSIPASTWVRRPTCRSASKTATASPGRPRSAARPRASSIRT